MPRRDNLITGQVYHIYNRSIAKFRIFNNEDDYQRMYQLIQYYRLSSLPDKFSRFIETTNVRKDGFQESLWSIARDKEKLVRIIAYCLMPTHIHLLLEQLCERGIAEYVHRICNGYSHYFNLKYKRKGPLWEGRFKNIRIEKNEQLMHLTRYIHLNPVTDQIINKPEGWTFSSYSEYVSSMKKESEVCDYSQFFTIQRDSYKKFVADQISYQRELAAIKHLVLEA